LNRWSRPHGLAALADRSATIAATAALTIALGVGAGTAVFTIVYGILFRPLPYRDANRLVVVGAERDYAGRPRPEPTSFGLVDYEEWRSRSQ
jgi:putative ABC transport system permease protein